MVAYNPRIPPDRGRVLSADVDEQMRAALVAHWKQATESDAGLRSALAAAAKDAKERQLRPEELLLAMKAVEGQVADLVETVDSEERDRFRHWLVGACLRAYFDSGEP